MKTNKRTKKGAIIALCMAGAIAISGAFAFLSDSDSAINRFKFTDEDGEQTVDVRIDEPNWDEEKGKNILPLDTVTKDPQVVNDGENDVYAFVTVLVPTAKSVKLNNDDGTIYEASDVELFSYKVNDGWIEVDKTSKDSDGQFVTSAGTVISNYKLGDRKTVVVGDKAVTNKAVTDSNVYFTAHTYAYAAAVDGVNTMTTLAAGENSRTSSVFDEVTMINIADGKIAMTADEIMAGIALEDGTEWDNTDTEIAVKKGDTRKVLYTLNDGCYYTADGAAQMKTVSQLAKEDNINIYVDTYAIQASNLSTTEVNGVWDICVNTTMNNDASGAGTFDYFKPVANDIGKDA